MSGTFKYYTNFSFDIATEGGDIVENGELAPENFGQADAYLQSDDMKQYVDEPLRQKLISVEWNLAGTDEGTIDVEANQELTDDELAELSDWIKGQCSDGLGEGFESCEFAQLYDYNPWGGEEWVGAVNFDWRRNNYKLRPA